MYVVSNENVYSFDSKNGSEQWVFKTDSTYKLFNTTTHRFIDSFYHVDRINDVGSHLLISSDNSNLYLVDYKGNTVWEAKIDETYRNSVLINDFLYIVDSQDNLYIINFVNGDTIQKIKASISFTPIVANNTIGLCYDNKLIVISYLKYFDVAPGTKKELLTKEENIKLKPEFVIQLLLLSILFLVGGVFFSQKKQDAFSFSNRSLFTVGVLIFFYTNCLFTLFCLDNICHYHKSFVFSFNYIIYIH